MPAPGYLKPGSLSDQVLTLIEAAKGVPVARATLAAALRGYDRRWLPRALVALLSHGHIRETCAGYVPGYVPSGIKAPLAAGEDVPAHMKPFLAEVLRRAHAFRRGGANSLAVALLRRASDAATIAIVSEDLAALADLFEHAPGFYPALNRPARAA